MGFVRNNEAGCVNIYVTDLDGHDMLIHSEDPHLAEQIAAYRPIHTFGITEFTDEHPQGAKTRLLIGEARHAFDELSVYSDVSLPLYYYSRQSADEIKGLYKQAGVPAPYVNFKPSRGAVARLFDKLSARVAPFMRVVDAMPLPRL